MMRLKYFVSLKYIALFAIILQTSCYTVPLEIRYDNPFEQLAYKYAIHLDATWNTNRAEGLLKLLESIAPTPDLKGTASKWKISDETQDDIHIDSQDGIKSVTISSDVLYYIKLMI